MIEVVEESELLSVLGGSDVVAVDFWAPWCGPCRMLSSVIDDVEKSATGVKFVKVNVDEATAVASKYNIQTLPTVIVFKNGKEAASKSGFMSKSALLDFITTA
ncbi:MAG: thioredoxin [Holosporales bacterium]|jgi:thioredoxin 1|nr:thioredoxin [Holosporales bacterium]